eukprot:5217345-Amphidinium_carterae.1
MQQVLHDAGINPHLVPDLATRISTALAQTPDKAKANTVAAGALPTPGTPPPAEHGLATPKQTPPPPLDADAIIEAARVEAAKDKAAAEAHKQAAADPATAAEALAAGLAEAPPLPPAAVIMALAQPGDLPDTLPATLVEGTQAMAADSCLKRTAAEEEDPTSEEQAKRLREH